MRSEIRSVEAKIVVKIYIVVVSKTAVLGLKSVIPNSNQNFKTEYCFYL